MTAYERIVNEEKNEASIRMYGFIGRDVDGNRMAQDIAELDKKATTIHIYINSSGGSVDQGLSVVSAILSAKAYIHAHVDGIAASMAAVITVAADKVTMQDYAKLMIHDPFFTGKGSDKLSARDKKCLDAITDTLRTILSRRGCDKDKVAQLMKDETWFDAEGAKASGLVDNVVMTQRKREFAGLTTQEILNKLNNELSPKTDESMKEIAKSLGLAESATEAEIIAEIKRIEAAAASQLEALIATCLATGKKLKTVSDTNEARMKRIAAADFELFAEMVLQVEEQPKQEGAKEEPKAQPVVGAARLSDAINRLKQSPGGTPEVKNKKTWDWYQKNAPADLMRLEKEDKVAFDALLDQYEQELN